VARVLVIEDEAALRSIMRRVLLEGSHEVIEVDTTRAGLEQACSTYADVVLGDLCLGMRDGAKVMAAIRHTQPGIALIAVSGLPRQEILDRMNAAGLRQSVWCLPKPFRHEDLVAIIGQALAPPS
jgi:two-component system nitrogen regulation response regulator GlnG